MSEALRAFPNLWAMLPSLWILISSSSQESSRIFYVFIQSIIFLIWGCGCTGKQEDARWNLSMSSTREVWASMWQALQGFKCVFLISAHPASHLSLPLLLLISMRCRLCRCKPLFAAYSPYSSWGVITALNGKHSTGALHNWVRQPCLFPAVERAGTVKKMCLI